MVIKPKSEIGETTVSYLDSNMWDILSPFRFEIKLPKDYFPPLSDDDLVRSRERYVEYEIVDESNNSIVKFTDQVKEDGATVTFDLKERLNDDQKDKLIQGNFYYFKVTKLETRESASTFYKIASPDKQNENGLVFLIKEPAKIEQVDAVINTPKVGENVSNEITQDGSEDICDVIFEGWYVENVRLPDSAVYEYDTTYEARVRYIPKDNHKFSDTAKLTINGKEAQFMQKSADGSILMSAVYGIARDVIYYANCTVKAPVTGAYPATTAEPEDEEYTVESVEFYEKEAPHKTVFSTDTFKASTSYMVRLRLKAKESMRFSKDTTFCVNHNPTALVSLGGGEDTAIVDKEFTTGKAYLETASATTESSVVIKEGDTAFIPEFVSDEPSDYEVVFRNWFDYTEAETNGEFVYLNEGDPFETGKRYNLNVTLKPKSDKYDIDIHTGLTINGIEAKFSFYDSGKQEYYYSLPCVCKKVIMNGYCTVVEPTVGGSPVFTAESSDPTMYSVGWVDYTHVKNGTETHLGSDAVFSEGNQYRVYVVFEPTEEYIFADDAKYFINGVLAKNYYSKKFRIFYVGDHEHELTHFDYVEPTCAWEGMLEHWQCKICMRNYSDEACTNEITGSVYLPKTAHTPGEPVKENETWFTYDSVIYCTVCGAEISREWVATSGPSHTHTAGDEHKENEIAATCTKAGEYDLVTRCTECDDIISITHVETEKLSHTPGEVKKENDTGNEWDDVTYCTVCNQELTRIHQMKDHEHTPGEAVKENEVAPTCTHFGSYDEVVYCTECNAEISRNSVTVDKLPHTPGEVKIENETETTYDEVTYCTVCGDEINRNTVTKGEEKKGIYGDVDGDGAITANDALMILRNSVGMETFTPEQFKLADIDDDGAISANDALAVLRHSVGMVDESSKVGKPVTA